MSAGHMVIIEGLAALIIAGVLALAALTDLRDRRIPNPLPAALVVVFVILAAARTVSGVDAVTAIFYPLLTAIVLFTACAFLFARGMMGGGDVKLLSALGLYASVSSIAGVLLMMALSGGVLSAVMIVLKRRGRLKDPSVPYGLPISLAGLSLCVTPVIQMAT